jgi:hypothetical protein
MSINMSKGATRLTIYADAVRIQKLVVMDIVVIQPCLGVAEVSQSIPLTPSLWIELDFVVVRVIVLYLSPVDDVVFELDAPKARLSDMFETPTMPVQPLVQIRS